MEGMLLLGTLSPIESQCEFMQGEPIARTDRKSLDGARLRSDATGIGVDRWIWHAMSATGACG